MDTESSLISRQERRRRRRRDRRFDDRKHKTGSRNTGGHSSERYQGQILAERCDQMAEAANTVDCASVPDELCGAAGHDRADANHGNAKDHRVGASQTRREKVWSRGHQGRKGSRRSKLSVPENWADVPKMGSRIASSRFVAIRVPLDEKFSRLIKSQDDLWTPGNFLQDQASEGYNVRLVIDLTNTTKYYSGEEVFRHTGVKYVKLSIEGFKAPPRESEVEAFSRIVDEFIASNDEGSIAVHCTHGLNRTGYLVVSYLVQRNGMSVQEALKAFSDARPPGLIKHMYVQELFKKFAPHVDVELPELPSWATIKYGSRRR